MRGADRATLGAVIVSGSSTYPTSALFAVYRDQLGAHITAESARAITTALADRYVRDGFVRPEVSVDAALMDRGVLRVQVNEARITRVVFEGEQGRHAAALQRIADRLVAAAPLRTEDVPAALRDMRALAGLSVTASARRDPAHRNGLELVVRSGFAPVSGMVRMNNRGTGEIGPAMVLGQVFANGFRGGHERVGLIFAAATRPSEYLGGGLLAETLLGTSSTRTSLLVFRSRSAPDERPVDLDDRYLRDRAVLRFTRPLAAGTRSLNVTGALEFNDLVIRRDGARIRDDRLRILEGGLRASGRRGGGQQYSSALQLRKGLSGLGADLDAAGLTLDPRREDFLLAQWQGTALWPLGAGWSVRLDSFAQYSSQVLPDSERFKIGGDRLGRGFEVAEIAGDRGLGGKVEMRRQLVDVSRIGGRLSAYGFYDIGTAWKTHQSGRESAATSGLGFAMAGTMVTGYVEIAAPVRGPDIEGSRDPSVFAELAWHF